MKDDKKKKLPAEDAAEQISVDRMNEWSRQAALAEEAEAAEQQEEELTPGLFSRLGQKIRRREDAARERRAAAVAGKSPDRTLYMLAAIPFWAVAGTTLENAAALSVILILTLVPASFLRYLLRRRVGLSEWIALPISIVVATMFATAGGVGLFLWVDPQLYDSLGAYLFLLVAAPILMNTEINGTPSGGLDFWKRTFRFIVDFVLVILLTGAVREILGYGAILGVPLKFMGSFRMEAARLPFFGLIFSGILLAVIRLFHHLIHRHRTRIAAEAESCREEAEA